MTHEEAIQLFNSLSGVRDASLIPDEVKNDIRRLYKHVTGEPLRRCNCPDVYNDALIIISLKIKALKTMSEQKYKLKRGVVIQLPDTTDVYTHVNITDEVAKAYLEKYPQKSSLFEAIPKEEERGEQGENETEKQPKKRKK